MHLEKKLGKLILASTLLLATGCEPRHINSLPEITRDPRGSTLIGYGRYLEIYGYCGIPGIDPFFNHRLAEVKEGERYITHWSDKGADIVQVIQTDSNLIDPANTYLDAKMDSNLQKRWHVVSVSLKQGKSTLEEIEAEFSC